MKRRTKCFKLLQVKTIDNSTGRLLCTGIPLHPRGLVSCARNSTTLQNEGWWKQVIIGSGSLSVDKCGAMDVLAQKPM